MSQWSQEQLPAPVQGHHGWTQVKNGMCFNGVPLRDSASPLSPPPAPRACCAPCVPGRPLSGVREWRARFVVLASLCHLNRKLDTGELGSWRNHEPKDTFSFFSNHPAVDSLPSEPTEGLLDIYWESGGGVSSPHWHVSSGDLPKRRGREPAPPTWHPTGVQLLQLPHAEDPCGGTFLLLPGGYYLGRGPRRRVLWRAGAGAEGQQRISLPVPCSRRRFRYWQLTRSDTGNWPEVKAAAGDVWRDGK